MTIYISGPMTGIENFNHAEFNRVATLLRGQGHQVINPVELDLVEPVEQDWYKFLRRDLKYLMHANAVALLDNWQISRGSRLEVSTALQLDMPFFKVEGDEIVPTDITGSLDLHVSYMLPLPANEIKVTLTV